MLKLIGQYIIQPCLNVLHGTYKLFISPLLGHNCRFAPTCSQYAKDAINTYGLLKGSYLAVKRVLRCNPFGGSGYDPITKEPKTKPKKNV